MIRDWIEHETTLAPEAQIEIPITRYYEEGIPVMSVRTELGQWERTSNKLSLTKEYRPIITKLKHYLTEEINSIGDESMKQEIELLVKIISVGE